MAEENGVADRRATMATLDARVQGLDRDYQDLKRTLLDLDSKLDQSITGLSNRFENALNSLTSKIEHRQTPLVAIISTAIAGFVATSALLGGIGALVYGPLQRDTARLDNAILTVLDRGVFQREYAADQLRTTENIRTLRSDLGGVVQQQRYNTDQDRLTKALEEIKSGVEITRQRSYDINGRMSKIEQAQVDINARYDAVSSRLAQQVRDFVAAMREIDRGHPGRTQ